MVVKIKVLLQEEYEGRMNVQKISLSLILYICIHTDNSMSRIIDTHIHNSCINLKLSHLPDMTSTISFQMVVNPLNGPHATDGFISAIE